MKRCKEYGELIKAALLQGIRIPVHEGGLLGNEGKGLIVDEMHYEEAVERIRNSLFRPASGARAESARIPILTSSTRIFRPAGNVNRGRRLQETVGRPSAAGSGRDGAIIRTHLSLRVRHRSRNIFGRGIGKIPGRRAAVEAVSPSDADFQAKLNVCSSWQEDLFVLGPPL